MYEQPYQQQQPYGQYAPGPYVQQPKRSAIPKVIGILMIIFGGLGLAGGLIGLAMSGVSSGDEKILAREMPEFLAALKSMQQWDMIFMVLGLLVSLIQLIGGIACVKYTKSAPTMAIAYATITGLAHIAQTVITYALLKPALDAAASKAHGMGADMVKFMNIGLGIGLIIGLVISLAWAVIVLILMTRPAAKAACVN
jgi:hypothetical protein